MTDSFNERKRTGARTATETEARLSQMGATFSTMTRPAPAHEMRLDALARISRFWPDKRMDIVDKFAMVDFKTGDLIEIGALLAYEAIAKLGISVIVAGPMGWACVSWSEHSFQYAKPSGAAIAALTEHGTWMQIVAPRRFGGTETGSGTPYASIELEPWGETDADFESSVARMCDAIKVKPERLRRFYEWLYAPKESPNES